MESLMLEIVIRKDAIDFMRKTSSWYKYNMGNKAALHFTKGILNTIHTLAQMPTIGMLDEKQSTPHTKYYTFLAHPLYRIVYRYDATHLYIVAIRAMRMKN